MMCWCSSSARARPLAHQRTSHFQSLFYVNSCWLVSSDVMWADDAKCLHTGCEWATSVAAMIVAQWLAAWWWRVAAVVNCSGTLEHHRFNIVTADAECWKLELTFMWAVQLACKLESAPAAAVVMLVVARIYGRAPRCCYLVPVIWWWKWSLNKSDEWSIKLIIRRHQLHR